MSISLYISNKEPTLDFWGSKKVDQAVRNIIKEIIPTAKIQKEMTTTFGVIAKWSMKSYSTEKFEELLQNLAKI